jgi:hypothetical protein
LIVLDEQQTSAEPDVNLVKVLARAHEWFGRIARGEASGLSDIARAERLSRTYVTSFIYVAFLAPDVTRAILEGRQATTLTAKRLVSSATEIPLLWAHQARLVEPRAHNLKAPGPTNPGR